jgi:hypothetical protein
MPKDKYPKSHSPPEIENYALRLRLLLGVGDQPHFNIISVVENGLSQKLPGFFVEILPRSNLGATEAVTEFGPPRIVVREDIYEAAFREDPRSRFTIAHELGHLCLHWGYPRPRLAPKSQRFPNSPRNSRIEAEANQFAGAFLMPRAVASKFDQAQKLASLCRVSDVAASRRLHDLWFESDGLTTKGVRSLFGLKLD